MFWARCATAGFDAKVTNPTRKIRRFIGTPPLEGASPSQKHTENREWGVKSQNLRTRCPPARTLATGRLRGLIVKLLEASGQTSLRPPEQVPKQRRASDQTQL